MTIALKQGYEIGEQVANDPLVVVVNDFLSREECAHVIGLAHDKISRGRVTLDGKVAYSPGRTGSTAWIPHSTTPTITSIVGRVSELIGLPPSHAESLQVVHYAETQEYRAHHDAWKRGTTRHAERTANGGQRLVTALMYLNQVSGGGATGFPNLNIEVEAIPGRMVLFHNTEGLEFDVHKNSLHGGLPVVAGEKWACNLWFREHPYNRPSDAKKPLPKPKAKVGPSRKAKSDNKKRKAQKNARRRNR
ncbi:MAG: 2OG-Fe(II) oxygenase [Myxococcota bacterium]